MHTATYDSVGVTVPLGPGNIMGRTNELAYTGASVIGPVIAGIVLIGAGIGALFFVRRRKANHS